MHLFRFTPFLHTKPYNIQLIKYYNMKKFSPILRVKQLNICYSNSYNWICIKLLLRNSINYYEKKR